MKYKLLGRSGLRVSELCLGTMTFGEAWGWGASRDESRRIFDAFAAAGGNFIDTANRYTDGESETLVGEFVRADRDRFVIATKYTLTTRPDDPNASGNHRKCMVQSLEASLERLGTDHVDLYWVHAWEGLTPVEEVMRALDDVVRAGKVLYVGVSDAPAWVVAQANTLADLRGWSRFVGLQIEYSLLERTPERDLLPMARALDLAVTAWGPLGGGLLTGKYRVTEGAVDAGDSLRADASDWRLTPRNLAVAGALRDLAAELELPPAQVALAWLRTRPGVVIPILVARTLAQMEENMASLAIALPRDAVARLDEMSAVPLGFPYDFLARPAIRRIMYGDRGELIEAHRPS